MEKRIRLSGSDVCPLATPFNDGSECVSCPPDTYFNTDNSLCEKCKDGTKYSNTHKKCIQE